LNPWRANAPRAVADGRFDTSKPGAAGRRRIAYDLPAAVSLPVGRLWNACGLAIGRAVSEPCGTRRIAGRTQGGKAKARRTQKNC
jgi:hypothetical protein